MPQTYRAYPVVEIALACFTRPGRVEEGDIVACRAPLGMIGTAEAHQFLWLLVEGLDASGLHRLDQPWYSAYTGPQPAFDANLVGKRRFCIPFRKLQQVHPGFDPGRARNPADLYQPFLPVETDTGYYRLGSEHQPQHGLRHLPQGAVHARALAVHGLVFDRQHMAYLPTATVA